jgi:rifampicin phosphotransferase
MISEVSTGTTPSVSEFLLALDEAQTAGSARVGSKAANVAALRRAGFPAPDGLVLTVEAFHHVLAANGLALEADASSVAATKLPDEIAQALEQVIARFGDVPLAVRSSGVAEDLPDASYAGQYDTVLDVRGLDRLQDAVRRCWASAFNERVAAYQRQRGDSGVPPVAVLIQPLVQADAAGVAFTVNPVTGNRDEVLVGAVRGLGERLVSGLATPDEWVVRGDRAEAHHTPEQAIDAAQALRIAEIARRVEDHFGAPQDIEWAIAGDDIYLLQARPVTGLEAMVQPIKPGFDVPKGFWTRDTAHFTGPISPMGRSFYGRMIGNAMSPALREFGLMLDGVEVREIGGYIYVRIVPPGGKEGPAPPWWLLGIVVRVHPGIRATVKRAREAERSGLGDQLIDRWSSEWRDSLLRRIDEFKRVDLTPLSDGELDTEIERRLAFYQESNHIHFRLFIPFMKAVTGLVFSCRDVLGWETRQTMELVSGLSEMSTEPSRRLAELADMARGRPAVRAALRSIDGTAATRLRQTDPEFAAAFDAYQDEFGVRALGEDVREPTLAERPEITLGLLKGQIESDISADEVAARLAERREQVAHEARRLLRNRPADLARFEEILARAQRTYPVREDNSFPTYQAQGGLFRYALLETGRRLADRGVIERRDDVMFLELPEARAALRGGGDFTALVARRKGEFAWSLANPGPLTYGQDPGPPPDMRAVPIEVRSLMEALMWFVENDLQTPPVEGNGIRGVGASAGTYTGPARVIRNASEFHKLQPGDVLVCPVTSPVWSVLFSNAGALVTDGGGILSHSAIIAREYGIPAAVATGDATSKLTDGQIVTVDGVQGTVRVDGEDSQDR